MEIKVLNKTILEVNLGRKQPYGKVTSWGYHDGEYHQGRSYKPPPNRLATYNVCYNKWLNHELAHSIVSVVAAGIGAKGIRFLGNDRFVALAHKYLDQLDFQQLVTELPMYGDNFIRIFDSAGRWETRGRKIKLAMLPPDTIDIEVDFDNSTKIIEYWQVKSKFFEEIGDINTITEELLTKQFHHFRNTDYAEIISPQDITHMAMTGVSNAVYGTSILKPLLYMLDRYDETGERLDRIVRFRSAPALAIIGLDQTQSDKVKAELENKPLAPNMGLGLPPGCNIEVIEAKGSFPLIETIQMIFEGIVAGANVPMVLMGLTTREQSRSATDNALYSFAALCMRYQELLKRKLMELFTGDGEDGHTLGIFRRLGYKYQLDDFEIAFPPIFDRNPRDEAIRLSTLYQDGAISWQTYCEQAGFDPEVEAQRIEDERAMLPEPEDDDTKDSDPRRKFPKKKESDYDKESMPEELQGIFKGG